MKKNIPRNRTSSVLPLPTTFSSYVLSSKFDNPWFPSCCRNLHLASPPSINRGLLSFSIPFDKLIHIYFHLSWIQYFFKGKTLLFAKEIVFPVNLSHEWHQDELETWKELGALVLLSNLWATTYCISYTRSKSRLM